jgi:DNA-binding XRE family transcriptional regulator
MSRNPPQGLVYQVVNLEGVSYAILPEAALREVCRRAAVHALAAGETTAVPPDLTEMDQLDGQAFTTRLIARRKRVGLSQASLAREAGIRVESLNRIERGKVTPDFATIRKLVTAIKIAESQTHE